MIISENLEWTLVAIATWMTQRVLSLTTNCIWCYCTQSFFVFVQTPFLLPSSYLDSLSTPMITNRFCRIKMKQDDDTRIQKRLHFLKKYI